MASADRTLQILPGGQSAAPFSYVLPASTVFSLLAVRATFDGSGAGGAFLPCVQLVSDAGVIMAQTVGSSVAAGGSADASFFPWVKKPAATPSAFTYAQTIAALASTYTLVAEWRLSDGATPYADTSGFAPADPATMVRQVSGTAMTQALATGPLAKSAAGPSVRFNFDGTAVSGTGDFLKATDTTPARYQFAANAVYTVVAWVFPSVPVNSHDGPVVETIRTTGFGTPAAQDDGWRINVVAPTNTAKVERWTAVTAAQNPDTVTLGALGTTGWTMLGMTYDGATLRGYLDGSPVGSVASAGNIGGAATNAQIGAGPHKLGDFTAWYFGAAAQISVWAAKFTDSDMALLYTAATT